MEKGTPRTPVRARLSLLPSGPGEVHRVTPHEGSCTTVEDGQPWICGAVPPARRLGSAAMTGHTLVLPPPRS
jgi:hypothetical protein